ncbi:MAG: type II toxin-antitoxin system RelE/ParE family toxin [Planctomycetes bacterium]|nr:type II toxin-antitoxin system RelE/ParE family toxin [Planctomycetota bacterium]
MPRVDYAPQADEDLMGIADYIARDNPNAARRWVQKIRDVCLTLATQPDMGELRKEFGVAGCRSFSVGNYVIFFRAVEGGIEVARMIHASRDMRNI